ncbi:MAG: hypothetical protein NTV89_07755 [Proteobacteria bacterium]|nr:hypothetical protein [Pseudomonadota bacterium]
MQRRMTDAATTRAPHAPVEGALALSSKDVMPFLLGEYDEEKIEELIWGFTLIDWSKKGLFEVRRRWEQSLTDHPLLRAWCVLKLLHVPGKIRDKQIRLLPRITQLLSAGRIRDACDAAIQRLNVSDLHPYRVMYDESIDATRLLASLMIPVQDQWRLESLVLEKQPKRL